MTTLPLDLTVVIPNYNTRELLRNCLDSVYRYTEGISFEVICVDGNSPDGSADMVADGISGSNVDQERVERVLRAECEQRHSHGAGKVCLSFG